jgi:hypothetical protein
MATAPHPSSSEHREQEKAGDKTGKSQMVVVDLEGLHSPGAIKRLRRGKGKLFHRVERIVSDLVQDGTVKSIAQPVVVVVREGGILWPFELDEDEDVLVVK